MPSRLRTPRSDLDRLPQFEPDRAFNLDETRERVLPFFSETRARQIQHVLASAMKGHLRDADLRGEPTSLKRFLGNAMLAIARYERRSLKNAAYDRRRAIKLLKEERRSNCALQRTLERQWKELDRYLEQLFVADRQQKRRQHDEREDRRPDAKLTVRALLRRRKLADQYRKEYRSKSLGELLNRLKFRETLITLAIEKVEFQPGDFQREEIVREFADAMVFAWMSATGAVPTISKSRPLPFQQLLATINREILRPEIRHKTDFRYPAVLAAERARRRMKGKNPRP